ncbi:four helix bundle protein [Candidatus Uhrbacteria bacterium]|nr:four helix bundle protein [Candidatus Uhrbacteria bacterium]
MGNIHSFRDLLVWQKAHQLVLEIYRLTKKFPSNEMFGLVSQIRRATVSVASNIVEGFNRSSVQDSLHFYTMAHASLEEVKYQLLVARDLQYITQQEYNHTLCLGEEVSKLLRSWINSQKENTKA